MKQNKQQRVRQICFLQESYMDKMLWNGLLWSP